MNARTASPIFSLPDLGEGLPDAELLEWHVQVGDTVRTDQLLLTVETAKAVVEVPSPQDGVILSLFAQPGDLVKTGAPLVEFEMKKTRKASTQQPGKGSLTAFDTPSKSDTGTVVGQLRQAEHLGEQDDFFIGVSPSTAAWQAAHQTPPSQSHTAPPPAAVATIPCPPGALPLKGVRRQMSVAMSLSQATVAPVTLMETVDIHAWPEGSDTTIRLVQAIVAGCQVSPQLNAWAGGDPLSVILKETVDVGIAVDTEHGLFVPVLRDVAHRSPEDLRAGLNRMRQDIKTRRIPPAELIGATLTLSNYGTLAGRFGTPVVVPPQVAIIGAGVIREEVVAWKGKPAVHRVLPLSVTFDHRVATGGEAARFMKAMIEHLQQSQPQT
ncbi:MAG: 2-oxo acid dehydrogenase subunit E2 [Hahellaceae bacterium]|nr:2-oxo acid dehydrogenase subunit E2 [Hahellaceae bacterium]